MPEQILRRIRREVRPRARRTVKMVRLPDKQMGRGAAVQAARRRFCSRPARWSSHWDSGLRFSTSEDRKQDGSGRTVLFLQNFKACVGDDVHTSSCAEAGILTQIGFCVKGDTCPWPAWRRGRCLSESVSAPAWPDRAAPRFPAHRRASRTAARQKSRSSALT